jgi:repressor LexA
MAPHGPWRQGDKRRDAIVEFVAEHHREKGYGPTLREVAAAVGLKAHGTAQYQIQVLVAAGVLAVEPRIPRSIRLVANSGEGG